MTPAGERVMLLPVPRAVARGVVDGAGLQDALDALGVTAATGWPHADTRDAMQSLTEDGPDPAHGSFLVVVDGAVIGDCGWLGGPDGDGDAEIGYGLAGSARGRGLGREAVATLASWVEQQPGVKRVTADVLVGNEPSRRLLVSLGFSAGREAPPYVTYVRERPHMDRPGDSG